MGQATLIGVGLYTIPEAARIVGVKSDTLRGWIKARRYSVRGTTYDRQPVIARALPDQPSIVTFLELIELFFIKIFRDQGVSMAVIRRASQRAAELFDSPYPFAVRQFDTDGKRIFATLRIESDKQSVVEDISRGQYAFEYMVRPFFRKLDYHDGDNGHGALKFWPLERQGRVVLDPRRSFGTPIDAEKGVPTSVLFSAVAAGGGQTHATVAKWFDVPIVAVEAAVRFERSLLAA